LLNGGIKMENSIKFLFSGDSALVIEFGNEISVDINKKIRKMMDSIKKENIDGIIELVPTYCSLLVNYDVLKVDYRSLVEKLKTLLNDDNETVEDEEVTLIEIPTLYNDECGPDLAYVAEYNKLSKEEVIKFLNEHKISLINVNTNNSKENGNKRIFIHLRITVRSREDFGKFFQHIVKEFVHKWLCRTKQIVANSAS